MQKKQVAVIDIGSSKITAVVGERGTNKTFIIKGRFSYDYDGFCSGEFFDTLKLSEILALAVKNLSQTMRSALKTVYVGVPSDFTQIFVKESQISFSKKKKITDEDVDSLFDGAFLMKSSKNTLINRSAIVYELDDFRRLANPLGVQSEILKGKLSFVVASEYFMENVANVLKKQGVLDVECVSSTLAQALYLLEAETRDRTAVILDVGYIASSLTIVQGDGIVFEKSFDFGGGYITAGLSDKFELDFHVAEKLKRKVNLYSCGSGLCDLIEMDNGEYFPLEEIKNSVVYSLETLCEKVMESIEESGFNIPEYIPLMITGGGISFIRGAKEHLAKRIGMPVSILKPKVPMMENPTESSILSLLNLALEQI